MRAYQRVNFLLIGHNQHRPSTMAVFQDIYHVGKELGRGAFGVVCEGEQSSPYILTNIQLQEQENSV